MKICSSGSGRREQDRIDIELRMRLEDDAET
jgi:hypothetical protein